MQSSKSVVLTVTRSNFQAMSSPRKASLWIQLKSNLCQNGKLHVRCETCNAFQDLQISIASLYRTTQSLFYHSHTLQSRDNRLFYLTKRTWILKVSRTHLHRLLFQLMLIRKNHSSLRQTRQILPSVVRDISSILSQGDDEKLHPVAFYSRKFDAVEINYEIHDKCHDMARLEPMTLFYTGRALHHQTIHCNT